MTMPTAGTVGNRDDRSVIADSATPTPTLPLPPPSASSRTINWWPVFQFVAPLIDDIGPLCWPGTHAWSRLHDDDPEKLAAVICAGMVWTLTEDTRQHASHEASQCISAACDWRRIARQAQQGRGAAYIRRSA